ncbi:hypothetical protein [Vibrio intestinalis]|uniref:hypothetical protein n=1 Tax=Vibrio intestinalis TaxID=2933291 RepID=UPI0021A6BD5B|nr:hypothetical protein [Vibrio intestinalis]
MGAKKSLKKLKKKVGKVQSKSLKQLKDLAASSPSSTSKEQVSDSAWQAEFKQVSQQALVDVASELAAPLNPVLSWFNEGCSVSFQSIGQSFTPTPQNTGTKKDALARPNVRSIVHLPMKSPPCKRCPALSNGVCKCAAKKLQKSA